MGRRGPRLGIPGKLLLVSSVLLLLPWLGLGLVRELQQLVQDAQEQTVADTARRAAVALRDRPSLLLPTAIGAARVLRILDLPRPVVVDGLAEDWDESGVETHRLPELDAGAETPAPFSVAYRIGRHGNGVYLLVEVRDEAIVLRDPVKEPAAGDRLELWAVSADDELLRFELDAASDGPVAAWLLRDDGSRAPDNRIAGSWRAVEEGYQVELRLPRTLAARRLALAAIDVDDPETRAALDRLASSGTASRDTLARVVSSSPGIGELLQDLGGPRTRLSVVDAGKHVLAQVGSLEGAASTPDADRGTGAAGWLVRRLARAVGGGPWLAADPLPGQPRSHEVDAALAGSAARARCGSTGRWWPPCWSRRPPPTCSPSAAAPSTASWARSSPFRSSGRWRSSATRAGSRSARAGCATPSTSWASPRRPAPRRRCPRSRPGTRSATSREASSGWRRGSASTPPTSSRWAGACRTSCARRSASCARRSTTCGCCRCRRRPASTWTGRTGGCAA